jgi:hypothetical protein
MISKRINNKMLRWEYGMDWNQSLKENWRHPLFLPSVSTNWRLRVYVPGGAKPGI